MKPTRKGPHINQALKEHAGWWTGSVMTALLLIVPLVVSEARGAAVPARGRATQAGLVSAATYYLATPYGKDAKAHPHLSSLLKYAKSGGATGKVISATPHTIAHYARILDERKDTEGTSP